MPDFLARVNASHAAMTVPNTTNWLHDLHNWPAPLAPTWVKVLPTALNNGMQRASVSGSPPIMQLNPASRAPAGPPDTGESSIATPSCLSRCANPTVAGAEMVLKSITTLPALTADATPFVPN